VASGILGVPVEVPEPAEYVALGAARQAAWALSGAAEPPAWPVAVTQAPAASESYDEVRDRYASVRTDVEKNYKR
jgi:xylulokinase